MDFRKKYDGEVGRHEQGGCLHQDGRGQVGLGGEICSVGVNYKDARARFFHRFAAARPVPMCVYSM